MESLGYLLVYLIKGHLPWQGLKGEDRRQKYARITECKKNTPTEDLCKVHMYVLIYMIQSLYSNCFTFQEIVSRAQGSTFGNETYLYFFKAHLKSAPSAHCVAVSSFTI